MGGVGGGFVCAGGAVVIGETIRLFAGRRGHVSNTRKVALELALQHSDWDENAEETVAVAAVFEKYLTGGSS